MAQINVPDPKVAKIEIALEKWRVWMLAKIDAELAKPNLPQQKIDELEVQRAEIVAYTWTTWTWKVFKESAINIVRQINREEADIAAREALRAAMADTQGELGDL